jgi:vacuolar-type H+-ATPase subunit F/Vma7
VIFNTDFSKLGWANKQVVGSSPAVALFLLVGLHQIIIKDDQTGLNGQVI